MKNYPLTMSEAFDPRANSIGFLRWLMAFMVIFSHAGPLAGFYHGHDLGVQFSKEQSFGGVATCGFFFFSGYLITKSRMGKSSLLRYFWRRVLRIFPAFWVALLLTAFVLAPIAWRKEAGSFDGYFNAQQQSPLTYFLNNMFLNLGQRNIAEMGTSIPYASHGAYDWNGSAWTLIYEFKAYILVGLLGLFGLLANRLYGGIIAGAIILLNAAQWAGMGNVAAFNSSFKDIFLLMFLAPFSFGMLFALFDKYIKIDDRVAVVAAIVAVYTYTHGGWNIWGQYGFCYVLMWFAIRVKFLRGWEKYGDFSYGVYIFAWPIMQFLAFFQVQKMGWLVYHLLVIVIVHIMAYASWHLIEKPAMSLKNWTPRPLQFVINKISPRWEALQKRIFDDKFSSLNPRQ